VWRVERTRGPGWATIAAMDGTLQQGFFRSVSEAFERNREAASQGFELVLLGLLALLLAAQAIGLWRRRRGLALDVEQLARQRGLTPEELAFARALSKAGGVAPMELLTHLDTFERVTGKALEGALAVEPGGEPLARQVRHLRHLLHFDRLPTHAPLLSTRELAPGTAVRLGAAHGEVTVVDEERLEVELRAPASLEPGAAVTLELTHAREARYELRCRVQEVHGGVHLRLTHDEAPVRVQLREFARVKASGPIALVAVSWPGHALERREVRGRLVDVSGGGALVAASAVLPPGVRVAATFQAGGQAFTRVEGVVVATHASGAGAFELHLEFTQLRPAERERLVGAVAKLQLEERSAAKA
jgi:c-di-GMP-binding flagellar brake protein YcgR